MAEGGATREEIARRFGVSERLVSQRLRLGTVAPALMQAYRDEKLTLEALTAFAVCDDEARQLGAWEKLRHGHVSPHAVRRLLTEGSVLGDSKIARFVGEEAYCAAGGTVTRDLFGEERYFENAALLESLAMRKLQEKADALKAEGWAHAEASLDANRETMRGYGEALDPDDCSDAQKRDGRVFLWIDHDGRAMAMAYREKTADDSSKPENAALAENARDSAYSATLRDCAAVKTLRRHRIGHQIERGGKILSDRRA